MVIVLPFVINAQTHRIDSLKKQIAILTEPSKKWDALFAFFREKNSYSSDTLYKYTLLAKEIAGSLNDELKKNWVSYNLSSCLLTKGKTDSVLSIIDAQINKMADKPQSRELYLRLVLTKANALNRTNKTKEALTLLYKLLSKAENENDLFAQAYAAVYIGTSYEILGQYNEAQTWFYKGINIIPKPVPASYKEVYSSLLLNTGITYYDIFQGKGLKNDGDSCEYYLTKAIAAASEYQYLSTLAYATNVKAGLFSYSKRFKEAEALFKDGLAIRKQIGDPYYIINDIVSLANFYLNSSQPDKLAAVCKEGIQLSDSFNINSGRVSLYNLLAESYKASGDYRRYGETLKLLVTLQDSIYKTNSAEALSEMQTKYEVQKKENTIIQQKYDLSRKNYFIYGAVGLLIATLMIGYAVFQNRKKTQRLKLQAMVIEQKQRTTQAVIQAEEEERKRIAGDLHDSVAQKMVVAKLNLEALGNQIQLPGEQQKIYNNINLLLHESATEVRNLSHSMMPQAFTHSGLTHAVKDFLDKIENNNLKIAFSSDGDFTNIRKNTALMIYRIIQECAQNVLKHAKASRLDVAMIAENNEVDVTIEDNGIGFDVNAITENSVGMKNIRSRIEYLNGKLDINSQPGSGTVIAFFIPVNQS